VFSFKKRFKVKY